MSKLNLVKANKYSDYLDEIIMDLQNLSWAGMDNNLIETKVTHHRSKAHPELDDYTELLDEPYILSNKNIKIEVIDELIMDIMLEQVKLKSAIKEAENNVKKEVSLSIGTLELSFRSMCDLIYRLEKNNKFFYQHLNELRDEEIQSLETGHTFNKDGNQVEYVYEVTTTRKVLFDKEKFNNKEKETNKDIDKLKDLINKMTMEDIVSFVPKYSCYDNIDDVINKFINSK